MSENSSGVVNKIKPVNRCAKWLALRELPGYLPTAVEMSRFFRGGGMDRFVVVTTVGEQRIANTACAALESGGIPVMIEHVHVRGGSLHGVAYRVLVPMQYSQTALSVLSGIGVTHPEEQEAA